MFSERHQAMQMQLPAYKQLHGILLDTLFTFLFHGFTVSPIELSLS